MEKGTGNIMMKQYVLTKYVIPLCLSLILVLFPCQVFSSESDLQSESELNWVMKSIKGRERNLNTFTAKFVQLKKTCLLKESLRSEGIIYFDRTGKMLLRIISPSPLILLLKDNTLLTFYPDLSKAEEIYLGSTHHIFKKYFGIGKSIEEMQRQYAIQLVSKTDSDVFRLKLIPKVKTITKYIETIEVVVSSKHWLPDRIHFKELKGDNTSISLQFTSINEPLPPGIFTIDIPRDDGNGIENSYK
jgi:outer membrane lipoprotein-sorting protein